MKLWSTLMLSVFLLLPAQSLMAAEAGEAAAQPAAAGQKRLPVKLEGKSTLPLRVLTRAMSSLYKGPDENSGVVQGNLPAFVPYYVYTRPGGEERDSEKGWYEVGPDNRGTIAGWLKTEDIFEWHQTMCLTYTHPENRKPVLMFDSKDYVSALVGKDAAARGAEVEALYKTIESGSIPKDFHVVSVEPKMAVDFTKQFYLLPILQHQNISVDGREGRMLELAAVGGSGADAREKTDIRENTQYAASAAVSSAAAAGSVQKDLKFDVVWVVDTTRSMGPYINATRDVVRNVAKQLAANPEVSKQVRFGVWGYRDPVEAIPAIEYTTKNFTPELLDINAFVPVISEVKETTVDSVDFPEDTFSGVSDAVTKTKWTPGAIRVLILVGDAPGHELGHKWNVSGYDETTLRQLASENNVTLVAMQIRPKGAAKHQKKAESQFTALALNPGTDAASYYSVNGPEIKTFGEVTATMVASLSGLIDSAQKGKLADKISGQEAVVAAPSGELAELEEAPAAAQAAPSAETAAAVKAGNEALGNTLKAAMVQWIGSEAGAKPPRDVVAWVVDKDLADSNKQALDVRLLINKRQLDSLAVLLADIITAGRKGQISGDDFFTSLQAASAVASRDPNMLKNAKSLGGSGLIPEFLSGLPYHSRLMDMSNELWNSWSPDEQDNFLNELDARTKAYKALHDNPQGWVKLNEGADADESVYPIPLDLLP